VADEGLNKAIVDRLRLEGHDVLYIAETDRGVSDDAILEMAVAEGRIVVTLDKGFGQMVFGSYLPTH